MKCKNCNFEIPEVAAFCPSCGFKVAPASVESPGVADVADTSDGENKPYTETYDSNKNTAYSGNNEYSEYSENNDNGENSPAIGEASDASFTDSVFFAPPPPRPSLFSRLREVGASRLMCALIIAAALNPILIGVDSVIQPLVNGQVAYSSPFAILTRITSNVVSLLTGLVPALIFLLIYLGFSRNKPTMARVGFTIRYVIGIIGIVSASIVLFFLLCFGGITYAIYESTALLLIFGIAFLYMVLLLFFVIIETKFYGGLRRVSGGSNEYPRRMWLYTVVTTIAAISCFITLLLMVFFYTGTDYLQYILNQVIEAYGSGAPVTISPLTPLLLTAQLIHTVIYLLTTIIVSRFNRSAAAYSSEMTNQLNY